MSHLYPLYLTTRQAYKRSLTCLTKPLFSKHHPIHTHTNTISHLQPTVSPTGSTPIPTATIPLPASYTSLGSVYVHWPYCRQRCSYCNFVKFIPRAGTHWTLPHSVLEDAMVREVEHTLSQSHIRHVPSVFFGGGTPSLARPQMVEKVLRVLQDKGYLLKEAEVTLEVNPTSIETQALRDFREAGINRVSIGVQSFEEATLKLLHRDHGVKEARHCLEAAQKLFPGRTSLDLIFGVPNHSFERWEREVKEALAVGCDHLSLYQLTVERGTTLHKQVTSGQVRLPDQDQMAHLYTLAVEVAQKAGLDRYEVSNFARCKSGESIHNKGYWQGQQYLGIGPGAHSRLVPRGSTSLIQAKDDDKEASTNEQSYETDFPSNADDNVRLNHCETSEKSNTVHLHSIQDDNTLTHGNRAMSSLMQELDTEQEPRKRSCASPVSLQVIREARVNVADPANWLREVHKKGDGTRKTECQTRGVAAAEYLASGLRMREGVTARQWKVFLPHLPHEEVFGTEMTWLADAGLLHLSPEGLSATNKGLAVLDAFLPHLYNILHTRLT